MVVVAGSRDVPEYGVFRRRVESEPESMRHACTVTSQPLSNTADSCYPCRKEEASRQMCLLAIDGQPVEAISEPTGPYEKGPTSRFDVKGIWCWHRCKGRPRKDAEWPSCCAPTTFLLRDSWFADAYPGATMAWSCASLVHGRLSKDQSGAETPEETAHFS